MPRRARLLLFPLLLFALATPGLAQTRDLTRAELLADTDHLTAGESFTLGVRLRMAPEWHTYWEFSGDAGLPTTVEWRLPPGFKAGPLQWPAPHKYTESGDLTVYGYADEVLLLAQIQAPASLKADTVLTLGAAVTWLACREVCIPGDTTLGLQLRTGKGKPANSALFSRYQAQVPGPLTQADPIALSHQSRSQGDEIQVDLALTARSGAFTLDNHSPDFYPLDGARFAFAPTRRTPAEGSTSQAKLHLSLKPYDSTPLTQLRGLLVYHLAGEAEPRHAYVELPLDLKGGAAPGGLLAMDFRGNQAESTSLGLFLLLAALGGLLLNLMPCVLPVISLKILGLVSQSGADAGRVRLLGLAFAAGIVAAFAGLALLVVALRAGGEQLGWGFQFQSPGFVMAMGALVFALGLSLFGVFTVQLPGLSGVGTQQQGEGGVGSFLNGVLATVLATPCTAPFLGAAMGFAFSQPGPVVL
ncbi:MAG: thiol:disulfide interchange protein, partial [Candidatus Latescibacteria bacterium]|nr:thiol:disulfide interchange protein [Candidatus Latescibacterota bacterium]